MQGAASQQAVPAAGGWRGASSVSQCCHLEPQNQRVSQVGRDHEGHQVQPLGPHRTNKKSGAPKFQYLSCSFP